jgi:tellurite resistance protein
MAENTYLRVIHAWAAMAWADGKMVKPERQALERLIASAELSEGERAVALGYLDEPQALDARDFDDLGPPAREGVFRAACKLSAIDKEVADSERALLARLQQLLGIDEHLARAIEAQTGLGT